MVQGIPIVFTGVPEAPKTPPVTCEGLSIHVLNKNSFQNNSLMNSQHNEAGGVPMDLCRTLPCGSQHWCTLVSPGKYPQNAV